MTIEENTDQAECRNCKKLLRGKSDYKGGQAYDLETNKECPRNWYGGFVCSEYCDRQVILDMESSMPGAGIQIHCNSRKLNKWE